MSETQLQRAAQVYLDRKSRKSSADGGSDRGGRWYPSQDERDVCCNAMREPSRAWPLSLKRHCCSSSHIARLFEVDELELKRAARALAVESKTSGVAA